MKKILIGVCVLSVLLSLCACGGKKIVEVVEKTGEQTENSDETGTTDNKTDEIKEDSNDGFSKNDIIGIWYDKISQRTVLNAIKNDDGSGFFIFITQKDSETSSTEWTMEASFNGKKGCYEYKECVSRTVSFDKNGNQTGEKVLYKNGTGTIVPKDGGLVWYEGKSKEEKCVFEPAPEISSDGLSQDMFIGGDDDIVGVWED